MAQPERGREYVRLRGGDFHGALSERSDGGLALGREVWSAPLRVRCARPRSYVVFSVVTVADARWCGLPLERGGVLELQREWEITTRGALEAVSFGVECGALERAEALLGGGARAHANGANRMLAHGAVSAASLRAQVASVLAAPVLAPAARHTLVGEFLHLAATLRRGAEPPAVRLESAARRRAAVRRIEEYLDAHERDLLSVAELCAVAGTSERTLEYAFREQLGVSPVRYLRLRRLNAVRRELRAAEPGAAPVTQTAMRWGFWQLGRFAVEYRALFGERPSETARRR